MITHFPNPPLSNIGGCQLFQFADASKITQLIIPVNNNIIVAPAFTITHGFLNGYASQKTLILEEKPLNSTQAPYFETKISGFFPSLSSTTLILFETMTQMGFVVLVKDNNQLIRLCGTPQIPMSFSFLQSTGNQPSDRNGFSFSFFCHSQRPSPFYSAAS